jgi:anti-anti-sigma factor
VTALLSSVLSAVTNGKEVPTVNGHLPFRAEIFRPSENLAVLAVEGEIDVHADPHFRELLIRVIAEEPRDLIVDLTRATTLDCAGLGVLVSAARRAGTSSLAIVCSDQAMTNIFALVGVDRMFRVFDSRAAALAAAC